MRLTLFCPIAGGGYTHSRPELAQARHVVLVPLFIHLILLRLQRLQAMLERIFAIGFLLPVPAFDVLFTPSSNCTMLSRLLESERSLGRLRLGEAARTVNSASPSEVLSACVSFGDDPSDGGRGGALSGGERIAAIDCGDGIVAVCGPAGTLLSEG